MERLSIGTKSIDIIPSGVYILVPRLSLSLRGTKLGGVSLAGKCNYACYLHSRTI